MDFGKSRGQITAIAPYLIVALISIILLFSVVMPILNVALYANGSGTNGTGINSVVNGWNNTGYPTALVISQQFPILFIVLLFVALAMGMIKFMGGLT